MSLALSACCSGAPSTGPWVSIGASTDTDYAEVSSGQHHCGLTTTGEVRCWGGWATRGEPPEDETFTHIAVVNQGGCGLREDGSVACWDASFLSKGAGAPASPATDLDGSQTALCAVLQDGTLHCWACLGHNKKVCSPPQGDFLQVSVETDFACAIRSSGAVTCWGCRANPDLCQPPADPFVQIDVGGLHSCGVTAAGVAACWGNGDYAPDVTMTEVAVGFSKACGITSEGSLLCWDPELPRTHVPPVDAETYVHLDGGLSGDDYCAVTDEGRIDCWGDEAFTRFFDPPP